MQRTICFKDEGALSLSHSYLYFNVLFPDSPPGAVVGVAEDLLARSQGRRVVTAGGGADINSFGYLQGNLFQFFVPKLFVSLKSELKMLETWTSSEIRILSVTFFLFLWIRKTQTDLTH